MSPASSPLPPSGAPREAPAEPGFLAAVFRRIGRREMLWAILVLGAVASLGTVSRLGVAQRYSLPPSFFWSMRTFEIGGAGLVMLALVVADEAVARGARRWPTYLGAVFVGALVGILGAWGLQLALGWDTLRTPPDDLAHYIHPVMAFFPAWLYGSLACVAYVNRRIAATAAARLREAELARVASRRRTLESRLQAMQARVEPQFLFNTLAQVRELFERDADLAGRMLEDLIAYLRAALPHLRESTSTLDQEMRLAQAYLDILRIRLGDALAFTIAPLGPIANARVPPMMILPLVDHALALGAVTASSRREIRIDACRVDTRVRITIADADGEFVSASRASTLEGMAQRLRALYGDAARFERVRIGERGSQIVMEFTHETESAPDFVASPGDSGAVSPPSSQGARVRATTRAI